MFGLDDKTVAALQCYSGIDKDFYKSLSAALLVLVCQQRHFP